MKNREAYRLITVLMEMPVASGTKLEHAKNQTLKNAAAFIEAYNDKLEDLTIDFCSTDEKGNIIKDQRNQYFFTKEKQRALAKDWKKFMDSETVVSFEIVSTSDKKGLSVSLVEYLIGIEFIREVLRVVKL